MDRWVTLNFVLSLTVIDVIMEEFDAHQAGIENGQPSFIIVEAKRASTLNDYDSEAELIGQLKSYMIRRYKSFPRCYSIASSLIIAFPYILTISEQSSCYGCLTDGKKWRFYVVDGEKMFIKHIIADNRQNAIRVLGRYLNLQPLTNYRCSHLFVNGVGTCSR